MLPPKLLNECCRLVFVEGFILGFRSDTHEPWCFFLTKNIILFKVDFSSEKIQIMILEKIKLKYQYVKRNENLINK